MLRARASPPDNQLAVDAANEPAMVRFNYSADGLMVGLEHFANANEIGAVWALAGMGVNIDKLTKEQEKYLASWEMGT